MAGGLCGYALTARREDCCADADAPRRWALLQVRLVLVWENGPSNHFP